MPNAYGTKKAPERHSRMLSYESSPCHTGESRYPDRVPGFRLKACRNDNGVLRKTFIVRCDLPVMAVSENPDKFKPLDPR